MTTADRVRHFYDRFQARDMTAMLAVIDDEATFLWMCSPEDTREFSGLAAGKEAFAARLAALDNEFEYAKLDLVDLITAGDRAAAQIMLTMRRRATGQEFQMPIAAFWTLRDGRLVEYVEYYDSALAAKILAA